MSLNGCKLLAFPYDPYLGHLPASFLLSFTE